MGVSQGAFPARPPLLRRPGPGNTIRTDGQGRPGDRKAEVRGWRHHGGSSASHGNQPILDGSAPADSSSAFFSTGGHTRVAEVPEPVLNDEAPLQPRAAGWGVSPGTEFYHQSPPGCVLPNRAWGLGLAYFGCVWGRSWVSRRSWSCENISSTLLRVLCHLPPRLAHCPSWPRPLLSTPLCVTTPPGLCCRQRKKARVLCPS